MQADRHFRGTGTRKEDRHGRPTTRFAFDPDLAAGLSWNSVFNAGGTVTFAVADSQGAFSTPENTLTIAAPPAATSLASLVEDQQLNSLA